MLELVFIIKIIVYYLEYWDGSGKLDGFKEEEILIEFCILGLVFYF